MGGAHINRKFDCHVTNGIWEKLAVRVTLMFKLTPSNLLCYIISRRCKHRHYIVDDRLIVHRLLRLDGLYRQALPEYSVVEIGGGEGGGQVWHPFLYS
jgi:hypothetical protein